MTHSLYFIQLSVKHFVFFSTSDIPRQAGVRTEEEGPVWSAPPFGILDRRTVIVIHGKTLINPDISETLIEKNLINGHPSIIQLIKPNNSFEPKKSFVTQTDLPEPVPLKVPAIPPLCPLQVTFPTKVVQLWELHLFALGIFSLQSCLVIIVLLIIFCTAAAWWLAITRPGIWKCGES